MLRLLSLTHTHILSLTWFPSTTPPTLLRFSLFSPFRSPSPALVAFLSHEDWTRPPTQQTASNRQSDADSRPYWPFLATRHQRKPSQASLGLVIYQYIYLDQRPSLPGPPAVAATECFRCLQVADETGKKPNQSSRMDKSVSHTSLAIFPVQFGIGTRSLTHEPPPVWLF